MQRIKTRPMDLQIAASARSVLGKQTSRLRSRGLVPGVLFGKATGSQAVQLDAKELETLYHRAGRTSIVQVSVDGGRPTSAIIKSITRHPLSGRLIHVDLHALDLRAEMQADIPLAFVGSAPVVEMEGAILFTSISTLKVRALPADLPHEISVDLSALTDLDATIHVSDLSVGDKVTILNDPEELVAKVTPARAEEEPVVAAAEEGAAPEAGEAEGEGAASGTTDEESGS
jgi:large subunit ribosomal protein L25